MPEHLADSPSSVTSHLSPIEAIVCSFLFLNRTGLLWLLVITLLIGYLGYSAFFYWRNITVVLAIIAASICVLCKCKLLGTPFKLSNATLLLSEDILVTNPGTQAFIARFAWGAVHKIARRFGYISINLSPATTFAIRIPVRSFGSPSESDAFCDRLIREWKTAQRNRHDLGICSSPNSVNHFISTNWTFVRYATVLLTIAVISGFVHNALASTILSGVLLILFVRLLVITQAFQYKKAIKAITSGQADKGVKETSAILKQNRSDHRANIAHAIGFLNNLEPQSAVVVMNDLIPKTGSTAYLHTIRALGHLLSNDVSAAMSDVARAHCLDSKLDLTYVVRASPRKELCQYHLALEDCTQAILLNDANPAAWSHRATVYLGMRDLEKALSDVKQAKRRVERRTHIEQAHSLRVEAMINCETGNPSLAIINCTTALKLAPGWISPVPVRAYAYLLLGNLDEAQRDLANATRLDSIPSIASQRDAYKSLLFLLEGDVGQALGSANKALQFNRSPLSLSTLGLILHKMNRLEEARATFDEAILKDKFYAAAYWYRARVLRSLGETDYADKDLEHANALKYHDIFKELYTKLMGIG